MTGHSYRNNSNSVVVIVPRKMEMFRVLLSVFCIAISSLPYASVLDCIKEKKKRRYAH